MYGSAKPEALTQMPQGKQGQAYKAIGYETSEKIIMYAGKCQLQIV